MAAISELLLSGSAEKVHEDSLTVADVTEVAKSYSHHVEKLG